MKKILLLLIALFVCFTASAQYVFVIGNPANGGEIRVGKSINLGTYIDGSSFVDGVKPGETVYFDFRPYTGWEFTEITYDENLSSEDVTLRDDGIYSFTMPNYEGTMMIMIYIGFQKEQVVVTGLDVNEENFPDPNFRNWLLSQSFVTDAVITDVAAVTKITARACGIVDLTGIQHFTELTELDVSNSAEIHPQENWNRISSIDLSGNPKLRKIWVNNNLLTSLDLSHCPDLRNIDFSGNLLTQIDVSSNEYLHLLYCEDNQLTSLDVTHNPDLGVLGCQKNQLTSLNVTNNLLLEQLFCENNKLTSIDVANHNKMMLFNCNDNQLSSLDLTGCTALFQLYFYNNQIKGEAMQNLVNSLETPPNGGYMVVLDLDNNIEQNEITESQAAIARAKSWSVEVISNGDFAQFEGGGGIQQDEDGYYLIGSVDDWDEFAEIVAETPTANAKMIADVDLGDDQTTIGHPNENPAYHFKGVFDGQGHTLTVHYVPQGSKDICSPFPNISEATIKNIHIDGTIVSSTACQPAAIGDVRYGTSTIEKVWSSIELTSTKSSWCEASGLVGCVDGYKQGHLIMTDCLVSGTVKSSGSYEGCFIGYINGGGSATVSNCLSVATFEYSGTSGFMGNYTNCYVKQFPSSIPATMQCSDEQLADGTIATALQASREEEVWVQDTKNNTPMLKIFLKSIPGDVNCDGSVNAADVTALYNYILNGDTTFLDTSDVNNDGAVNAGDVTAVYNIILGSN